MTSHHLISRVGLLVAALFVSLPASTALAQEAPQDKNEIIHVLNRITFGPRPGDVETVEKMGLDNYIQQQLHPESIDDSAVEREVAKFSLLQMTSEELAKLYVDEKATKKVKKDENNGNTPPRKQAANAAAAPPKSDDLGTASAIEQIEEAKLVRAVDSNRQLQEVLADFWNNHFNVDVKKKECRIFKIADDRDAIRPHIWGKFRDLLEASAKSPAMLVYLDNATNTAPKHPEADMAPMQMTGTKPAAPPAKVKKKGNDGINENYAREIMELHTVGVDGGYTQKDVQEVARCFTGWGVEKKTGAFEFKANEHDNGPKVVLGHQIPANGGMKDGETVLDILASSPATAHHLSLELCQRFVSDNPPAALVDRIAGVFTQTGGDLRQVTAAILASPEFRSPTDYGTKIKSPFEFAVSAVRASGSTIMAPKTGHAEKKFASTESNAIRGRTKSEDILAKNPRQSLNWHIAEMGEPLFACSPPTGYKEVSTTWVSPGALIERLNFATALTNQELSDIHFDAKNVIGSADLDKPDAILNQSVATLLPNNLTDNTRKVLEKTVLPTGDSKTVNPNQLIALIIGSPEFQRK